MLKVKCKACDAIVEVPIPEPVPVEKIVKEPCKCGLTEDARVHRSWATALAFAAVTGILVALGSCYTVSTTDVQKVQAETEKMKVQNASNQKEMETMATELKKYKDFFEEFKKGSKQEK